MNNTKAIAELESMIKQLKIQEEASQEYDI
jgi:hypothetical protein